LVATGAWSAQLLATTHPGWGRQIMPRRGVLLRSAQQQPLARHVLLEASYYPQKSAARGASLAFSLQQLWDGRLLLGGTRSFAGFDDAVPTEEQRRTLLTRAVEFLPALAGIPLPRVTVGLRPWTPDGLTLVAPT